MRAYIVDNEIYWSVTSIVSVVRKPGLERWRGEIGNVAADRVAEEAAQLGSTIHDWCAKINETFNSQGRIDPQRYIHVPPVVFQYIVWLNKAVTEVKLWESVVVSRTYRYAGRLDLVAKLAGDKTYSVIDIKTSKQVWPEYGMQLAAYRQALKEQGIIADRLLVVHLDKITNRLGVHEFDNPSRCFQAFLAALTLFNYLGFDSEEPEEVVYVNQ
ncbi:MAG: PD-(D/E)XK nuclease family protein [Thermacetogeniaceae bacterium]